MGSEEPRDPDDRDWYVLVFGLPRPAEPLALAPGVTLQPIQLPLDFFDLLAAGAAGFRQASCLERLAYGCTAEIHAEARFAELPGYNTVNRAWLALTMLVLRGYANTMGVACSRYSWNEIPHPQAHPTWGGTDPGSIHRRCRDDLPRFEGGLLDYHTHILPSGEPPRETLHSADVGWVNDNYVDCHRMIGESRPFRFALEACADWRFAKEPRSGIARLWSGIEALFGVSSELRYRVSLIAASLLEERGQTRLERFRRVNKLYNARSKAVHGDEMEEEEVERTLRDSFSLLRELLAFSIEGGNALSKGDMDKAVFF